MQTQSKTKAFLLIIGILLIANLAELSFFILRKEPHKDRAAAMSEYLKNEIGFSTSQMQQYDSLNAQHGEQMKASMDELRNKRQQDFKQVANDGFSDSAINNIVLQSVDKQKVIELQLFQYIKAIRSICTPDQQAIFDTSFYKVMERKK